MKVICPVCKTVYSADSKKINYNKKKKAKCFKCQSYFFIQKKEKVFDGLDKSSKITFLQSYFEKRKGTDRRNGVERRKINIEDLPFTTPSKDIIPIFNDEDLPIGYINNGKRNGTDRRRGIDRRVFQEIRDNAPSDN